MMTTPKATAKITTMSLLNTTFINNISMLGKKLKVERDAILCSISYDKNSKT